MSSQPPEKTDSQPTALPTATGSEEPRAFLLWALRQLGLQPSSSNDGQVEFTIPEELNLDWPEGRPTVFGKNGEAESDLAEGTSEQEVLDWAVGKLSDDADFVYCVPAGDPQAVHEFSSRLFDAYTVDGGRVQLAGCQVDPRPILRLTYSCDSDGRTLLKHVFLDNAGSVIDAELHSSLGLADLSAVPGNPPRPAPTRDSPWVQQGISDAHLQLSGDGECRQLLVTVVWCNYASGTLEFEVDGATARLPFSGWARHLAEGNQPPPAYSLPGEEVSSHHLAGTDDGQVAPIEAIGVCGASGQRRLHRDMQVCAVTGTSALPEYMETCPATGKCVLADQLVPCRQCDQGVCPEAIARGLCQTCRELAPVAKDEPRLARILGEYPGLDEWRNWKLAESARAYVLLASGWLRSLLVVIEKETLSVLRLAERSRLGTRWSEIRDALRQEMLG